MPILRFLTAGESHGPKLTAIMEGMVAGLPLSSQSIDADLARRQRSLGSGSRMTIEQDHACVTAGVLAGLTTGGPIGIEIANLDYANWATREIPPMTVPRPGHADLTGAAKYRYHDLRPALERASARETAARVAVGAICKSYLGQFGIKIGSMVLEIGPVVAQVDEHTPWSELLAQAEACDIRCPDGDGAERMRRHIRKAIEAGDTAGGVFEVVATGVPPGLGSLVHFDRRLSGRLLGAVGSIQAIKGVEIGHAFALAAMPGTSVHDEIFADEAGGLRRSSNRAGGIEGGISTGEPILVRAAMKPIATTLTPLQSVDLATGIPTPARYERSDYCAVPRAAVVAEAMVAWVLADELIRKLGGDSLDEQIPRAKELRESSHTDLVMNNRSWQFGYE